MTNDDLAVLQANEAFYAAFQAADMARMERVWASSAPVTCCHPGWTVLAGRARVLASWRAIFGNPRAPRIQCTRPRVWPFGDLAYVVCFEGAEGGPPVLIATNIFVREEGAWRMVHHHAGQLAGEPEDDDDDEPPGPLN